MKGLRRKLKNFWNEHGLALLAILTFCLVFFYPVWGEARVALPVDALVGAHIPWVESEWEGYPAGVPIKNLEITDAFSHFYPWRSLVGQFWREGKAPLWNYYMFSGTPFLATLHSAGLYPLNFVYLLFSNAASWNLLVFLQVFLSAVFMYLFLDEIRLRKIACLLGAVGFAMSGYMIAWLEFGTGGHAGLWLPLVLVLLIKFIKSLKFIWLVGIACIFYFVFTAGDFQVPVYVSGAYLLFGFYLSLGNKKVLRSFVGVIAGLLFGVLLSLPQLLPSLELFNKSVRVDDAYIGDYFYGLMHWENVANFVWPDFFGNVVTRNYWGKFDYHEYLAYGGVATLVFAFYSLSLKKLRYEWFFWMALVIALLFLFPTPLGFLPYKLHIPALGTSSASRIIFLVDFCLATLGAIGFSKWIDGKANIGWVLGSLFGVTLVVAVYLITNVRPEYVVSLRNMILTTGIIVMLFLIWFLSRYVSRKILAFVVIGILFLDMLRFGYKNTPFSESRFVFPDNPVIEFLLSREGNFRIAGGIPLNLHMPYGLESAEGYDPIYPMQNGKWFSKVNFGHEEYPARRYGEIRNYGSELVDYANVGYVVDYKKNVGGVAADGEYYKGIDSDKYEEVYSFGRVSVFENKDVKPRVWVIDGEGEANGYYQKQNEFGFEVFARESVGVFVSQSFDDGWKAYVDGVEVKIDKSGDIFMKVEVPSGEHEVRFIYRPLSFRIGEVTALTTSLGLLLGIVYEKKVNKKN